MRPFTETHLESLVHDLHLLEALLAASPDTRSDLQTLRRSIPQGPRRGGFETRPPSAQRRNPAAAIAAAAHAAATLDLLQTARRPGDPTLEWLPRARRAISNASAAAATQSRENTAARVSGLYVIVDPEATRGRPVLDVAEAALRGGATVIQLRDKLNDAAHVLATARNLRRLCASHGALFVMNDDAAIALAGDADGLHVGQSDLPAADARRVLSDAQIVGRSNDSVDEALRSQADGADYLAVGAVYATATMGKSARKAVGPQTIAAVKAAVSRPVVAIGGIDRANAAEVVRAGADCVCVVSAITMADNPEQAANAIADAIETANA